MRRLPLKGSHDLICQLRLVRELVRCRRQLRDATVYLPEPGPMLAMMLLQFFTARPETVDADDGLLAGFSRRRLRRLPVAGDADKQRLARFAGELD